MNAQSLLQSYGWLGPGHPLHPSAYKQKGHRGLAYDPTSSTSARTTFSGAPTGLVKPLLVTQKQGRLGVGRKAHEPQQGNEWWLKGFEKALGEVGKSESERTSGASTPVVGSEKEGGLYSFFVRGEEMQGTIGGEAEGRGERGRKRKSDVLEDGGEDEKSHGFAAVAEFMAARDKKEKRRRKLAKGSVTEEFKAIGAFMEAREGKPPKKKRNSEKVEAVEDSPASAQMTTKTKIEKPEQGEFPLHLTAETKEERRERQRRRKEAKQSNNAISLIVNGHNGEEGDTAVQEALRKSEKKRRKAQRASGPLMK